MSHRHQTIAVAVSSLALLAGCSVGGGSTGSTGSSGSSDGATAEDQQSRTVVVATHESWNMDDQVLADFTEQTGYTTRIIPSGDAGELTNKLVLTKDSPIADVAYGVDNTFASRAGDAGVFADYTPADLPPSAERFTLEGAVGDQLTPIDYGDVCVNVDDTWFAERDKTPPRTLADLTKPAYRGLFVTPAANSSSPGLAFLLSTVAEYGEDWPSYWRDLVDNDAKIVSGWTEAYQGDFTAGGGNGSRPVVLSYASSPPFTIPEGKSRPTTSALLDTCYRQVEYAGVLDGAENAEGARAFVDFMTQRRFQAALPDNMYVFPVDDRVELPALWSRFARTAPDPYVVPAAEVAQHRADWLREWSDVTSG